MKHVEKSDIKCNTIKGLSEEEEYCLVWTGAKSWSGYGQFRYMNKTVKAHRYSYELFVGKIPDGLVIDHLCNNRWCVNPKHLEPVSQKENIRRGLTGFSARIRQLNKTHCPQNHPFSPENTYLTKKGFRKCKECRREYRRRQRKVVAKSDLFKEILA